MEEKRLCRSPGENPVLRERGSLMRVSLGNILDHRDNPPWDDRREGGVIPVAANPVSEKNRGKPEA